MQAFLQSADGADAWGLMVEAFRDFLELPTQTEQSLSLGDALDDWL